MCKNVNLMKPERREILFDETSSETDENSPVPDVILHFFDTKSVIIS